MKKLVAILTLVFGFSMFAYADIAVDQSAPEPAPDVANETIQKGSENLDNTMKQDSNIPKDNDATDDASTNSDDDDDGSDDNEGDTSNDPDPEADDDAGSTPVSS